MTRKVLRQALAIVTGVTMTGGAFFGLGLWRRSQDTQWCRQAAAGGVVAGDESMASDLLAQIRSACVVQRERQRRVFGALWRPGGQESARCGFELASLQLTLDRDSDASRSVLQRYGLDDGAFEVSDRASQDRFITACLARKSRDG